MRKLDIIKAIHQRMGFSYRQSAQLVNTTFDIIKTVLQKGETVKIASFGRFSVREKKERMVQVPKTSTFVPIPARKVITFKLSRVLRDAINEIPKAGNS